MRKCGIQKKRAFEDGSNRSSIYVDKKLPFYAV
jgi:hypothetical protein